MKKSCDLRATCFIRTNNLFGGVVARGVWCILVTLKARVRTSPLISLVPKGTRVPMWTLCWQSLPKLKGYLRFKPVGVPTIKAYLAKERNNLWFEQIWRRPKRYVNKLFCSKLSCGLIPFGTLSVHGYSFSVRVWLIYMNTEDKPWTWIVYCPVWVSTRFQWLCSTFSWLQIICNFIYLCYKT